MRPRDIDFEPLRVVRVQRAVEQSGEARTIKSTKNSQKRTATFPASLTADLSGHVEAVRRHAGDDALLFALSDGRPAERRQFLRLWVRAAKRAGCLQRSSPLMPIARTLSCWCYREAAYPSKVMLTGGRP